MKIKLIKKQLTPSGRCHVYFLGIKILSYPVHEIPLSEKKQYDKIWAKRFKGLTETEAQTAINLRYKWHVSKYYSSTAGVNWEQPVKYTEKVHWLKLYYRNPLLTICQDKVKVQQYIKEKIGSDLLVPCIGVWDHPDDIPFDELPAQFAAKVNWGCGQNIIVADKSKLNWKEAKKKLATWMQPKNNWYYDNLEWAYKHINPQILVERFVEQNDDYKVLCFNGKAKLILVCTDRASSVKFTWYDIAWNKLDIEMGRPSCEGDIERPAHLDDMLKYAEILAAPFPHVRIDFYYSHSKLFIGEMTFYNSAGLRPFSPMEWDETLGHMIELPEKMPWPAGCTSEDL